MNNETPSVGFRWSELDEYRIDIAVRNAKAFMTTYGKGVELRRKRKPAPPSITTPPQPTTPTTNNENSMEVTPIYKPTARTNTEILEDMEWQLQTLAKQAKAFADDPEITDLGITPDLTQAGTEIEQARATVIAALDKYISLKFNDAEDLV